MNQLSIPAASSTASPVTHETITVSPSLAQEWLAKCPYTRRLDKRLVSAYAREMQNERWKLNGEPIIFSNDDKLLAGRHRLWACVEAQTPFRTLVVRGVAGEAFETIDTLRRRTAGDVLTIRQLPAGRQLASALYLIWRYYNDDLEREKLRVPLQEALQLLNVYPELREDTGPESSIEVARHVTRVIPLGTGIAFHFLFSRVDRNQANRFFDQITEAEEYGDTDTPGAVLYMALRAMRDEGGRRDKVRMRAYIIKAWNAFYTKRALGQLRYTPSRETWPDIAGMAAGDQIATREAVAGYISDDAEKATESSAELGVEICEITPDRARDLLQNHPINRNAAAAVISRYARDMAAGRWQVNGQTIKITAEGRLIDGQHRLKACMEAKRPFPAIIVRNVSEDAFDTFDLGAKKSYHIVLSERGETNTTTLAAALKWLWLYERDRLTVRTDQPTPAELDDTLQRHPEIRHSLEYVNKLRAVIAPAIGIALHYLCSRKGGEHADEFFDRLSDGIGLSGDSPIYILRERLIRERGAARRSVASEVERIVWIIKAWNAWITNQPLRNISWRRKGPGREDIPKIIGRQDAEGRE